MTSLKQQMEELQKQQAILAEKIQEEEERNKKLLESSSIDRLDTLIKPITQYLNSIPYPNCPDTWRRSLQNTFINKKRNNKLLIKYQSNHMLANEEIFVTLLGIIKKQDGRINQLEELVFGLLSDPPGISSLSVKNKEVQYSGPHDGESWNYA